MTKSYYLDYDADTAELLINCGMLAIWYGLIPQATQIIGWMRQTLGETPGILIIESLCFLRQGDCANAEEKLRSALLKRPKDPNARSLLALTLFEGGKPGYDEIIKELGRDCAEMDEVTAIVNYILENRGTVGFDPMRSRVSAV